MNLEQLLSAREERLALEVLRQAVHDLRRFRSATGTLERELYRDAYRWITSSDSAWPYSFVNVCKLLDVPPDAMRAELLAGISLGRAAYCIREGRRFVRICRASIARAFRSSSSSNEARPFSPTPLQAQ
ncbi:MAG TPA: hypothetical protein VG095_08360 [Chthoniobacterales bacterium]|nr:hypothetical protein [Chthoniobacterales bacterium]